MTEALVRTIQTEYQELVMLGASHDEAISQVGIQNELHEELVEVFIPFVQ